MNRLSDLNISNQNLVIRVDMNVPIEDGVVTDNTRILACMPTIKFAQKSNAKLVTITFFAFKKSYILQNLNI